MKKAVFTVIACSIAALVLTGVLVVGLTSDGFGIGALAKDDGNGARNAENKYEYTWDPAETPVSGLEVDWINGPVDLKVGSGGLIRITESSDEKIEKDDRLRLSSSDGTLKVKWNNSIIFFSLFHNEYKALTVEVPREIAESLEELKCENTAGTITASGFTAGEMEFSSASGGLELSGLQGEEGDFSTASGSISLDRAELSERLEVNTVSGSVSLSGMAAGEAVLSTVSGGISYRGSTEKLEANSVSAPVKAELEQCPESAAMNAVSGNLTLSVPENSGFEAEYSSVSGKFTSEFPVTEESGQALYASGKSKFSFHTTSGDMCVLKVEK